jgi:hypothetical protein
MEWNQVATDPTTGDEIVVCEMHRPPEDSVQEFYQRVNEMYSDCERHWGKHGVLLVRRKKVDPNQVKTKKGKLR